MKKKVTIKKNSRVTNKTSAKNHSYSIELIEKAVNQVIYNHTSLRGAAKNLQLFLPKYSKTPSHTSIYNWIMKIGIGSYKARGSRSKYHSFVIDATIAHGKEKLLLVLGIKKSYIQKGNINLSHKDVDVLDMTVLSTINNLVVENRLKKAISKYGVPVQIISDNGGDIKKGIENIRSSYPELIHTYDITHKCAIELKHILKDDEQWKTFYSACGACRTKVMHTDLFKYSPPKAREKSRHLNLEEYIKWLENIFYVSKLKENRKSDKFQEAFGWTKKYKKALKRWKQIIALIHIVKKEVKLNGFQKKTWGQLKEQIKKQIGVLNETTKIVYLELKEYIIKGIAPIPQNEVWPGCSDIIESVFGRVKNYAKNSPFKEITRMIMAIPIFTGEITLNKIKIYLEARTVEKTTKWLKNNIGETYIQKRRNAFRKSRISKC